MRTCSLFVLVVSIALMPANLIPVADVGLAQPAGSSPASSWTPQPESPPPIQNENHPTPPVWRMPERVDLERPDWARGEHAHERMRATGDIFEKIYAGDGDRERYELLPQTLDGHLRVMLYTVGEVSVFQGPSHASVSNPTTYYGFKTSMSELLELQKLGTVVYAEAFRPHVTIEVTTKQALRDVLDLPFVYAAQLDRPVTAHADLRGASETAPYSLTWGQKQQKTDKAWNSRNNDDGGATNNGMIPRNTKIAIIDGGYSPAATQFIDAYAADQITHCHNVQGGAVGPGWSSPVGAGSSFPDPTCGAGTGSLVTHGTLVADILSAYNRGGSDLHVYRMSLTLSDLRAAYAHIAAAHPEIRVISSSLGVDFNDRNCRGNGPGFFDDVLRDLVVNKRTYVVVAEANVATQSDYPADTTWAFGVGGALDGNPWSKDPDSASGFITLTSACTLQQNLHGGTNEPASLFKPDVYGFFRQLVDVPDQNGNAHATWHGTSFAQPQVASGVAGIASRVETRGETWHPFKEWRPGINNWCGAARLVWGSSAPDGRDVSPGTASQKGNLADHDAMYLNNDSC